MSILGLGNALVDILLKLDGDETLSQTGMAKGAMEMIDERQMRLIQHAQAHLERSQAPGGSACNTMRTLARLGVDAGFAGKIGSDAMGAYYEEALRSAQVTPYIVKAEGISGCCTVLISPDGERTMGTFLGPAPTLTPDDITEEMLRPYDYIYIEGYLLVNEALVRSAMEKAKQLGLKIALDLSNFNIVNAFRHLLDELIPGYVDLLFSNESEAEAFTGLKPAEAVRALSAMAETAVVTMGKEGALAAKGGDIIQVAAEGGEPVDTTGAGDSFAAGFLFGQSRGATLEQSARIGALLAGEVIGVTGAQIPDDRWRQIKLKVSGILP
ncbi:MAG: adenosine kinase [Tannerellaceae bacterium]|nr:adenosine kinase [Tannerellaceae bacterium]